MYQVMIVDDEPTSVNLLKTVIEKKCDGFQVTEIAYDGTEAMEKLKGVQPDIFNHRYPDAGNERTGTCKENP